MGSRRNRSRVAVRGATSATVSASPGFIIDARPLWVQHLAALLLLALGLSLVLREVAWQGMVFLAADYEAPSYFAAAGKHALQAGEYPLWNPYLFLGMPSFASLTYTPWVFPPSELLGLLQHLPFVPPLGWLLVYFLAAGFGVYVLLHSLGCRFWPALLGGFLFMLTPHVVSMGVFGHGSKLASVAFLPWLLWAALRLRRSRFPLAWTACLGFLIGLQLLRGHPQIAFYGLLMLTLLGVVELAGSWRDPAQRSGAWRFGAALAGAVLLGFALAAVLLLPIREYAPESIRGRASGGGASYEFATGWSQTPGEVATFALPSFFGFGEGTYVGPMPFTNFPHYLGQATLLFALCALVFLRGRFILYLALLLLLSLLVSFGKHAPWIYDLFYAHLPYFNKFRVPVMILVLFQLGASIAAGLGLATLWGQELPGLRRRGSNGTLLVRRVAMVGLGVALLWVLVGLVRSDGVADAVALSRRLPAQARPVYAEVARHLVRNDSVRVAVVLGLDAVLLWTLARWRRGDVAGALFVVLAVVDLGHVDRRMVHPEHTWPGLASRVGPESQAAIAEDGLTRFLQARSADAVAPVRILPLGRLFDNNSWMAHQIASVGGYHPAKPLRIQKLFESSDLLMKPAILNMLSVGYIVSPEPLEGAGEAAYSGPEGQAYANPRAFPRGWIVGRWRRVASEDCVASLQSLDPLREVLLESDPPAGIQADAAGSAQVVRFQANRVELKVESSAPALLVLSEAYHPDWRATVDGTAQPVVPANCLLRAVPVPAGTSHVVFQFVDPAMQAGIWGTGTGAGMLVLLLLADAVRWRRRHAAEVRGTGEARS